MKPTSAPLAPHPAHQPDMASLVALMSSRPGLSRQLLASAEEAAERVRSLNALAYVDWEAARAEADRLDAEAARGQLRGPLHGIPIAIKDLYAVSGMPLAAGTRARLPALATEATCVARLRAAGALLFAKTNMHEIALGATGENIWTGDVCNPQDPARQAGGSSGGSGVAVATGIGLGAVGSDTGGSVRIPAAFSGIVGFKPTYQAIPLDGALALSWTCDHAGPMTRSVADAELLFEVMALRRSSQARPDEPSRLARRPRLAIPAEWMRGRLGASVRQWFESLCAVLAVHADLIEVPTPLVARSIDPYSTLVRAEAAFIHRETLAQGGQGFSEAVLAPLRMGEQVTALQYLGALSHRDALMRELDSILAGVDAMIAPTTAVQAPLRGQGSVAVEGGTTSVREAVLGQTLAFSYGGVPVLSLPWGQCDGLAGSLQVIGRRDGDAGLLALGRWFEGLSGVPS